MKVSLESFSVFEMLPKRFRATAERDSSLRFLSAKRSALTARGVGTAAIRQRRRVPAEADCGQKFGSGC